MSRNKNNLWIELYFFARAKPWILLDLTPSNSSLAELLACCFPVCFIELYAVLQCISSEGQHPTPTLQVSHLHYLPGPTDLSDFSSRVTPSLRLFPTLILSHVILWLTPTLSPRRPPSTHWLPYHSSLNLLVPTAVSLYCPVISLKVVNIHLLLSLAQSLSHSKCSMNDCWIN